MPADPGGPVRDIDVDAMSTDELLDLARRQVLAWTDAAVALLPDDELRVDAHCHLGQDSDGSTVTVEQLLRQLDESKVHHALVTPLHQAGGYAEENARVRELAAGTDGRLWALHRCDPRATDPAGDARRGLEAGAVGLKWHPRAERFRMDDDVARDTAAVAHEAGVPILIHAGRGMERLGEGVVELAREFPDATFMLAHAAISDLGWIIDATHDVENLVFDTSWWRPTDIAVMLTSCDPGRVMFGSDPPYGTVRLGMQLTARIARACGWSDANVERLMGGTARRLFRIGEDVAGVDGHVTHMPVEEPAFRRAGELLTAAMQVEFSDGDSTEVFDLACAALHVVDAHPRVRDAKLLHGAIEGGRALLMRDETTGLPMVSPTRRRGVELLICVLAHLATPALPIHGIDRVGWDDPAPFV